MAAIQFVSPYHRATQSPHQRLELGNWIEIDSVNSRNAPKSENIYSILRKSTIPPVKFYKPVNLPEPDEKFYKETCTEFRASLTNISQCIRFMPDHGLAGYDKEQGRISYVVEDSLWHSELHFLSHLTCEAETNWKWKTLLPVEANPISIQGTVVDAYHRYSYQYYHWHLDALPKLWLSWKYYGCDISKLDIFTGPLTRDWQYKSLSLFGAATGDKLITPKPQDICYSFESLVYAGIEFTENAKLKRPDFKSGEWGCCWSKDYFDDLRIQAQHCFHNVNAPSPRKLFVARSQSHVTHRRLVNEENVNQLLDTHGFSRIDPGLLSYEEQAVAFRDADCIVGIHGAGLTNIIFSKQECTLIELMPWGLNDVGYRLIAGSLGMRYECIYCNTHINKNLQEHYQTIPYADLEVDVTMLNAALERLDNT